MTQREIAQRNRIWSLMSAYKDGDTATLARLADELAVTDKANRQFDNVIEDCGDPAWARLATHDEQNETERNGGC